MNGRPTDAEKRGAIRAGHEIEDAIRLKRERPLTKSEIDYIWRRVAEWVAAGDVIEEHAQLCFNATSALCLVFGHLGASDKSLEQRCNDYHAALKRTATMDPKEYKRIKRMIAKQRLAMRKE